MGEVVQGSWSKLSNLVPVISLQSIYRSLFSHILGTESPLAVLSRTDSPWGTCFAIFAHMSSGHSYSVFLALPDSLWPKHSSRAEIASVPPAPGPEFSPQRIRGSWILSFLPNPNSIGLNTQTCSEVVAIRIQLVPGTPGVTELGRSDADQRSILTEIVGIKTADSSQNLKILPADFSGES